MKFKNMDIYSVARSFFLFKLPVIRDLLEVTLDQPLATEEELAKFDKTEFLDKNQETMIKAKIEEARSKRQDVLVKRAHRKEQIEKLMLFIDAKLSQTPDLKTYKLQLTKCELCS